MANSVCWTERLQWSANTLVRTFRTFAKLSLKSISGREQDQSAETTVPNKRSFVSGNVVNSSLINPAKAEFAVFRTCRSRSPDLILFNVRVETISAVRRSAPDCLKADGLSPIRSHGTWSM